MNHSLSAVRNCLFNIFASTLQIWRPFLHQQPEDAPCHGDRDPFITEWDIFSHIFTSTQWSHLLFYKQQIARWWNSLENIPYRLQQNRYGTDNSDPLSHVDNLLRCVVFTGIFPPTPRLAELRGGSCIVLITSWRLKPTDGSNFLPKDGRRTQRIT
jgi:hypothetical protein